MVLCDGGAGSCDGDDNGENRKEGADGDDEEKDNRTTRMNSEK